MTTRAIGVACVLLALRTSGALCQEVKKPPPTEQTADFGLVVVSGNTSTSAINANERYIRRIGRWEYRQELGGVYGKTAGVESSNLLRFGLRADYGLSEHFALYGLTAYDRNRFAGVRARYAAGPGVAWKVVATDRDQFNIEAGYQYTQQKNATGPDHNFSAARTASTWKHSLSKVAYFFQGFEYIPDLEDSQDYRINTETDVVAPLSQHIGMKVSYVVRFANQPPVVSALAAPLQKSDRILSAGIQVSY